MRINRNEEPRQMIDYNRLMKLISERGLTMAGVCKALGYSGTYIYDSNSKAGGVRIGDIEKLKSFFSLNPADYVIPEEPPETETVTSDASQTELLMALIEAIDRQTEAIRALPEMIANAMISTHKMTEEWRINEMKQATTKALTEKGL